MTPTPAKMPRGYDLTCTMHCCIAFFCGVMVGVVCVVFWQYIKFHYLGEIIV